MNPGDLAVLAMAAPAVLAAGPLAVRMAKQKREGAAVLRMLAEERAAREQAVVEYFDNPPDGGEPIHLAEVIPLRLAS